jgi:hypothetical protein
MKRVVEKIQTGYFYSEKQGAYQVEGKKSYYKGIIVSSCRFQNEIEEIKKMGGTAVRLTRPALSVEGFLNTGVANHLSEKEQLSIPDDFFDYVIQVPEGVYAFRLVIDEFMEKFSCKNTGIPLRYIS